MFLSLHQIYKFYNCKTAFLKLNIANINFDFMEFLFAVALREKSYFGKEKANQNLY